MPPNTEVLHKSSLGIKYPKNRDVPNKSTLTWLDGRRHDDGAEGLWRIHDDLYDLTDFIHIHPGGSEWLEFTKGTDCTEAFECHHISASVEKLLPKFHIRKAQTKRNYPYTFEENGFYRTLKRNAREALKNIPREDRVRKTKFFIDSTLILTLTFAVLACRYWSCMLGILSGIFLALTTIAAHNFFHIKNNFRMYYFDLSSMSSREWRISHALSHHLYPNTINDMEISMFEPVFEYMPKRKHWKYVPWLYAPLFWISFFHFNFIKRMMIYVRKEEHFRSTELIPFIVPLVMYLFGGQSVLHTLWMWQLIICAASTHFTFVGTNAAHHHPKIFHDGDTPRPPAQSDWAFHQLDAVMDRYEINGNHFLVLTNFGDHAMHHLFPTLDHGVLDELFPIFEKTAKDFGIHLRMTTQIDLIKGQFAQLVREEPNPYPPYYEEIKN